ncbi:MAG: hypothetical protein ACT4TC_24160, partial [Myxococcaceae bacterium]
MSFLPSFDAPMQDRLKAVADTARKEISPALALEHVVPLRVKVLCQMGYLSSVVGGLGKVSTDERQALGEVAN